MAEHSSPHTLIWPGAANGLSWAWPLPLGAIAKAALSWRPLPSHAGAARV